MTNETPVRASEPAQDANPSCYFAFAGFERSSMNETVT